MKVTICGHAGLFIEAGEERILIDPILRNTPLASGGVVHTLPRVLRLAEMPVPTLLLVTHAHLDHFDPESLATLPRTLPVIVPGDPPMLEKLRSLGFAKLIVLAPWQVFQGRGVTLTATPSGTDIDEFGLVVQTADACFWHMSDAEAEIDDAKRVAAQFGAIDLLSAKYQPASRVQSQIFRSLGACSDKHDIQDWLETACACDPQVVFPYASGVRFHGDHAWLNKHAFPFRADEITRLLRVRLGGPERAVTVAPGDVFEIRDHRVSHQPQACAFIAHKASSGGEVDWEPIEPDTLAGLATDDQRQDLEDRLLSLFRGGFGRWVAAQSGADGVLSQYVEFGVIWQLSVHVSESERLEYYIDFTAPHFAIVEGRHPYANFFAHVAGKGLLRRLNGEAQPEALYSCGDLRLFEKIIGVRDGRVYVPPVQGWELFECLPEPLTYFLRYPRKWGADLEAAGAA